MPASGGVRGRDRLLRPFDIGVFFVNLIGRVYAWNGPGFWKSLIPCFASAPVVLWQPWCDVSFTPPGAGLAALLDGTMRTLGRADVIEGLGTGSFGVAESAVVMTRHQRMKADRLLLAQRRNAAVNVWAHVVDAVGDGVRNLWACATCDESTVTHDLLVFLKSRCRLALAIRGSSVSTAAWVSLYLQPPWSIKKEPCVFKAKPASKTVRALALKKLKEAVN